MVAVGCGLSPRSSSHISLLPVSWPDENIGPSPPRITTRTVSSASAREERLVELDEHRAVLGVARLRPVQLDPHDRAVVVRLDVDEAVFGLGHAVTSRRNGHPTLHRAHGDGTTDRPGAERRRPIRCGTAFPDET